ncbi:MAG: polyketide cyclase [Dehalococcoidia bacterium]|nr:polyketide cyclase [Dehalococcoidia bacterium]
MRIELATDIAASPERAWAVSSDVERWPEWTASVTSVQRLDAGDLTVGSRVRIKQPKIPATVWRVTRWEPGLYFEWQAGLPGYNTLGGHRIEATPGGCRATLSIESTGPLAPLFWLLFKNLSRRYINLELEGLKRRSEAP